MTSVLLLQRPPSPMSHTQEHLKFTHLNMVRTRDKMEGITESERQGGRQSWHGKLQERAFWGH